MNKLLFVCGDFNEENGRKSGLMNKVYHNIKNMNCFDGIEFVNGGNVNCIPKIVESCINYNFIFWFPNIDNKFEKVRNIKEVNSKCMLVTSKRNKNEYSHQFLIGRALETKSNLLISIDSSEKDNFKFDIIDPLGNVFYSGSSVDFMLKILIERIIFLSRIKRASTIKSNEEIDLNLEEEIEDLFIENIRNLSKEFTNLINPEIKDKRFLGNASKRFRCENGFPSKRIDDGLVLVSKRNVDKNGINKRDFVPVKLSDNGDILYYGNNKPSVDTPIQINLYKILPNVNYMIHSHVYIENAKYTKNILPCGAMEEIEEIINEIDDLSSSDFAINLKGHGSTLFLSSLSNIENFIYKKRF